MSCLYVYGMKELLINHKYKNLRFLLKHDSDLEGPDIVLVSLRVITQSPDGKVVERPPTISTLAEFRKRLDTLVDGGQTFRERMFNWPELYGLHWGTELPSFGFGEQLPQEKSGEDASVS